VPVGIQAEPDVILERGLLRIELKRPSQPHQEGEERSVKSANETNEAAVHSPDDQIPGE
jgi:hypothetical protein